MPKFMLIIHQRPDCWKGLSPEELERKGQQYQAWAAKMHAGGRHVSSEKLAEEGGKR
jgi:hypothetical protein